MIANGCSSWCPDGNPLWQTDVKGLGDERTTDERVAQFEELIEDVQQESKPSWQFLRRSDLHLALVVAVGVGIAAAALLPKVFHGL